MRMVPVKKSRILSGFSNDILKLLDEPKTLEKCTEQIMILEKKDTDISSTLLKMPMRLM